MVDVFKSKRARLETGIWGVKLLLLCVGIVSTVVFFKVAIIPYLLNLTLSTVPHLWTTFRSCCLSPLYIYIILNFIIITIAASSAFQNQKHHPSSPSLPSSSITNVAKTPDIDDTHIDTQSQQHKIQSHDSHNATLLLPSSPDSYHVSNETSWHDIHKQHQEEEEESISMTMPNTLSTETCSGEDNTLDTTWKAIMEGQGKPMAKQLKKSETWDTPPRPHLMRSSNKLREVDGHDRELDGDDDGDDDDAVSWARRELNKSDTFSDRVSLRRDKSMTQEELNQRAEAFINKFNNQIRLQRLQSDQRRFTDMLNRAH